MRDQTGGHGPPANRNAPRRWVANILLLATGIALSLILAEGLVRVFFPHSRDMMIPGHLFMVDDELGWKFRPSRASVHRTRHFVVEYAINALGFRDKARPNPQRPRSHRILLYGDSLIFGWGVPQADRFSDLLEQHIDGLEVWNHAVPGYGLDQELLSYERDAESFVFDEVMFFVSRGTLERIHAGYIYAKYKPMFSQGPHGLTVEPVPALKNRAVGLVYEALSPFHLPYFVHNRMPLLKERLASGTPAEKRISGEPQYVDELAKALLERAHAMTRRKGQRMFVLVGDIWRADRRDVRRFCEERDIAFLEVPLDIAATSMNDDRMDLVLGHYDRHWNAKANRQLADELENAIRK